MRLFCLALVFALPALADDEHPWSKVGVVDGVSVEKRYKDGLWMRCTQRVPVPYEKLRDTFLRLDFGDWVDSLSEWKMLERDDEKNTALAYGRHALPWPMEDRDYVVEMKWKEKDGQLLFDSEPSTTRGPKKKQGVFRMTELDDVWLLRRANETETIIVYLYRANLGGNVPDFLAEAGMKAEGPATFKKLVAAALVP